MIAAFLKRPGAKMPRRKDYEPPGDKKAAPQP
jgi:hypothetical protein